MPPIVTKIKGSFVLKNNVDKDGKRNIHLRYYVGNDEYVYRTTSLRVKPEEWDKKIQRMIVPDTPLKKKNEAIQFNLELDAIMAKYDKKLREYDGCVSKQVVEMIMDGKPLSDDERAEAYDFFQYANQIVDTLYAAGKYGISVRENHRSNLRVFSRFVDFGLKRSTYMLSDIRKEHIIQFIAFRRSVLHNTSNQGIFKSIHPIQLAVKEALDNGLLDAKVALPIMKITVNTKRTVYTSDLSEDEIKYLTPEELQKVCDYRATLRDYRKKRILDSFFFSVYTGLRFSDVITLEWLHIQGDEIHKMQVKTKKEVVVPLTPAALEILDMYRPNKTRFVFGFLKDDFDTSDPIKLQMARNSKNRTVNVSLKKVAEHAGIDDFSFHAARHSFAVMSLEQGVNIYLLSQIMGHSATEITETYAKFLPGSLTKGVKEKMAFSFTPKDKK